MKQTSLAEKFGITSNNIQEMREWVYQIGWSDLDKEDVADLSQEQIIRCVKKHYDGGIAQFLQDCQ